MNYKQSNYLWDILAPQLNPNTFKVVGVIARQTWGMSGRDAVILSRSQLKRLTGIGSIATIQKAIDDGLAEGVICRQTWGNSYKYGMIPISETDQKLIGIGSETDLLPQADGSETDPLMDQKLIALNDRTDQKLIANGSETDLHIKKYKEKENKEEKEETPTPAPEFLDTPPTGHDQNGTLVPHHYQDFENANIRLSKNGEDILAVLNANCRHISRTKQPEARRVASVLDLAGFDSGFVHRHTGQSSGFWQSVDFRGKDGDRPWLSQVEGVCHDAKAHEDSRPVQMAGLEVWEQHIEPLLKIKTPAFRSPHVRAFPMDIKMALSKSGLNVNTIAESWAKDKFVANFSPTSQPLAMAD